MNAEKNAEKNEVINQFEGMVLKELALKKHDEFEESCMRYVSPATKKEDKKQVRKQWDKVP